MATEKSFVEYVVGQMKDAGEVTFRKMFGEYAIYIDGKITALVCDNRLFIKPTEAGREYIGKPVEAPAYPGAKNSFLIDDRLEDVEWLSKLVKISAEELREKKKSK